MIYEMSDNKGFKYLDSSYGIPLDVGGIVMHRLHDYHSNIVINRSFGDLF